MQLSAMQNSKPDLRKAAVLALYADRDWILASCAAAATGTKRVHIASKLLCRMQKAGLLVCIGRGGQTPKWYLAGSDAAIKARAEHMARAVHASTAKRQRAANRSVERQDFTHRLVSAASRKVPNARGPRWVFDLGVMA